MVMSSGPWSRSPSRVMASTSSVGRQGLLVSTAWQWYTTPSKTDSARILIPVEEHATALTEAIAAAVPGWVVRSVRRILEAWAGRADDEVLADAEAAGERAAADVEA